MKRSSIQPIHPNIKMVFEWELIHLIYYYLLICRLYLLNAPVINLIVLFFSSYISIEDILFRHFLCCQKEKKEQKLKKSNPNLTSLWSYL